MLLAVLLAGCQQPPAPAAGGPGGGPGGPVGVGIETLALGPVEEVSEYVAAVRSRASSDVRPQVDGIVTRILVRSGDRVAAGQPLLQVEAGRQEAAVSSTEASRLAQEAAVDLARQQVERARALAKDGLISNEELDRREADLRTAEAQWRSLQARERESRVELGYYGVTAPTDGIVGDIPVRVGDRVTNATVLTTIDRSEGLEVYVQVPLERALDLRLGLPIRLVDASGAVASETRIDFISPQVDDRTQTVLAKAPIPGTHGFRTEQYVRARLVWKTAPGLTIPALAVARINGQYFAYVAEPGEQGALVARQRLVRLGRLDTSRYLVLEGLKPGDRAIVSGIQKIADGVPVAPAGPA